VRSEGGCALAITKLRVKAAPSPSAPSGRDLQAVHCATGPPCCQQLHVRCRSLRRPSIEHDDPSAPSTWTVVGYDEGGALEQKLRQRRLYVAARLGVRARGRLVEDQDGRILQQLRAMAMRALARRPRAHALSPTRVSIPFGLRGANSSTCGGLRRALDCRIASRGPKATLLRMVSSNSTTSWLTTAICRAVCQRVIAHIAAVDAAPAPGAGS